MMTAIGVAAVWAAMAGLSFAEVTVDNGIPVVYVTVNGSEADIDAMHKSEDHSVSCSGTVSIDVPDGFHYADMPDSPCEDLPERAMTIKGRGNSTWGTVKKPYKLKLDKKADLFGLGANKHWVLLANAFDKTLLKDRITGWLGDEIGMEYTPRGVPVDLVLRSSDGTYDRYLGSYYLSEQVRVGDNRIEIDELEEDDVDDDIITGGYVVQIGTQTEPTSPSYFETKTKQQWANHTPNFDPDDDGYINDKQRDYIRGYMQDLEDAILSGDFEGKERTSYRDMMDIESAAKYWLVDQASRNADGYGTGSTYLYKPRGDKMYWGPLWDYDFAWYYDSEYDGYLVQHDWLYGMLYDKGEDGFVQEVKAQWPAVKEALIRIAEDGGIIDQYYEETKESQAADLELYPPGEEEGQDPDAEDPDEEITFEPEEEKEAFKEWILNRVSWLDENLKDLENLFHKITVEMDGVETGHIFLEDGQLYYSRLPKPEKEGYIWTGWQLEDGTVLDDDAKCKQDLVVNPIMVTEEDATKCTDIVFRTGEDYVYLDDEYYSLYYTMLPEDAQDKRIRWTTSDEEVASVTTYMDNIAEIELHKTGDVTFTATISSGVSKSFTLHIVDGERPKPDSIKTDQDKYELKPGEYGHIEVTPDPADALFSDCWLETEDSSIVEVDMNGVIKAIKPGRTHIKIIMVYSNDDQEPTTLQKTVEVVVADDKDPEIGYQCTTGSGQTWRKGSGAGAEFVFKRTADDSKTIDHFKDVKIDGKTLKASDYTVKSGSVVINVKPAYLEKLAVGKHTLTADFDDGSATAAFTVASASKSGSNSGTVKKTGSTTSTGSAKTTAGSSKTTTGSSKNASGAKTGDSRSVLIWTMLLLAAAMVLVRRFIKTVFR